MYKKKSENDQRRAGRITLKDVQGLPEDYETLDSKERRGILVAAHKNRVGIRKNLKKMVKQRRMSSTEFRRVKREISELGEEIQILQIGINSIRPKMKGPPGVRDYYITAAKELVGGFQHKRIMDRAVELYNESVKGAKDE